MPLTWALSVPSDAKRQCHDDITAVVMFLEPSSVGSEASLAKQGRRSEPPQSPTLKRIVHYLQASQIAQTSTTGLS